MEMNKEMQMMNMNQQMQMNNETQQQMKQIQMKQQMQQQQMQQMQMQQQMQMNQQMQIQQMQMNQQMQQMQMQQQMQEMQMEMEQIQEENEMQQENAIAESKIAGRWKLTSYEKKVKGQDAESTYKEGWADFQKKRKTHTGYIQGYMIVLQDKHTTPTLLQGDWWSVIEDHLILRDSYSSSCECYNITLDGKALTLVDEIKDNEGSVYQTITYKFEKL